jgi:hypothetical protein
MIRHIRTVTDLTYMSYKCLVLSIFNVLFSVSHCCKQVQVTDVSDRSVASFLRAQIREK